MFTSITIINRIIVAIKGIPGGHKKTMYRSIDEMGLFRKVVKIPLKKIKKCLRKRKINIIIIMIKWDMGTGMVIIIITIIIITNLVKRKGMSRRISLIIWIFTKIKAIIVICSLIIWMGLIKEVIIEIIII